MSIVHRGTTHHILESCEDATRRENKERRWRVMGVVLAALATPPALYVVINLACVAMMIAGARSFQPDPLWHGLAIYLFKSMAG